MDPGQSIKINPSLSSSIHVNMLHARELPAQEAGGKRVASSTYRIHLGNKQSSCRTTCCASRAQTMADHVGQMSASHKINELNHVKNKAKATIRPPSNSSGCSQLVYQTRMHLTPQAAGCRHQKLHPASLGILLS